jgi:hypothetical protein
MRLRGFTLGRPQQIAALLLLMMLGECLWTIAREPLGPDDYRYARCGREMWERPSAIAGYFTTCGNLNGDGTFGYRLAGFPLSAQRAVLLGADHFRKPEDRLYSSGSLTGSTWEARHEIGAVKWLLRLPFVLFALWLGGGLWWVARRLYGNEGGAFALALYAFCPAVIHFSTRPNNEVLAMWGLYGLLYTAIGVAHALQGPRRKWRPRILLLTAALGLTAAAHLLAGLTGFVTGFAFLFYLAERRRAHVSQIILLSGFGSFFLLFAFFSFRVSAFLYVFTGGSARFWFSASALGSFFTYFTHLGALRNPAEAGITIATLVALVVYATTRRCRYFGNTVPLVMTLLLFPLYTSQVITSPWLWALPFLFTFVGGVFADMLETRQRTVFLLLTGGVVVTQAGLCLLAIPHLLQ